MEQPVIRLLPPKPDLPQATLNERVVKHLKRAGRLDDAKLATVAARVTGALERGVPHPSDGTLMLWVSTTRTLRSTPFTLSS